MCLFALLARERQPDDLAHFIETRPMTSDDDVDALILWLRDNDDPGR